MFGLPIAFAAPAVLAALLGLTALYFFLRVTPPRPRQELFPPLRLLLGLVDVAATESAARQSFAAIQPLAQLVDPSLTATVSDQFAALDTQVAALGPPTSTPDASVTPTARIALSHQLDATASTLARLSARLTPFGTAGAPS